jgi:hypothetical protein
VYKVSLKKIGRRPLPLALLFLAVQKTPPAKMRGPKFAGRGSRMEEVHNNDFTDLETAGCDGHHIKPTPPATGTRRLRVAAGP